MPWSGAKYSDKYSYVCLLAPLPTCMSQKALKTRLTLPFMCVACGHD